MERVTTHEAKTNLSRLLSRVEAGEEILICRGDTPVARLVQLEGLPPKTPLKRPTVGTVTSEPITWTPDAFSPLSAEDLTEWGL